MCPQQAVKDRSSFVAGAVLGIHVTACLFVAISHGGATAGRADERIVSLLGEFKFSRSDVRRERPLAGTIIVRRPRVPSCRTLGCGQNAAAADAVCAIGSCRWSPLAEGLCEVRPLPVRDEVRRWGIAVFTGGAKALQCGQQPNRRTACQAPRFVLPSRSLQELYCLWVI